MRGEGKKKVDEGREGGRICVDICMGSIGGMCVTIKKGLRNEEKMGRNDEQRVNHG